MELGFLYCEIEDDFGIKLATAQGNKIKDWLEAARKSYDLHLSTDKAKYRERVTKQVNQIFQVQDLNKRKLELRDLGIFEYDLKNLRPKYFGRVIFIIYLIISISLFPVMNIGEFLIFLFFIPITYYAFDGWRPNSPNFLINEKLAVEEILKNTWNDGFRSEREFPQISDGILAMIKKQARQDVSMEMDLVKDLGFD